MGDPINSNTNTARTDQWTETAPAANETAHAETDAAPTTNAGTAAGTVAGEGASHGFQLEGLGLGGIGERGHPGVGIRLSYRAGLSLHMGDWRVRVHPSVGLDIANQRTSATAPNGEAITSEFTRVGLIAGADVSVAGPFLDHRMFATLGIRLGAGGFVTPETTSVNLPQTCTPDEVSRGECEPNAGPRTGNAGTTGLLNYDLGAARGTSGAYFYLSGVFSIGGEVARGPWGNLTLAPYFEAGGLFLMPGDGHAFSFPVVGGGLSVAANVGGNAVEAVKEETPQPLVTPQTQVTTQNLPEQPPSGEPWDVDSLLQSQLPAGARIGGVTFDGQTVSGPPYVVPGSSMTPGNHALRATYRMPGEDRDRILELRITSAAPQILPENGGDVMGVEHTTEVYRKRR